MMRLTGPSVSLSSDAWQRATMNTKLLPTPNSERQMMSPSYILHIFLEICRPRPMPLELIALVVSKNPNSLKSLHWSSSLMPTPVSCTWTSRYFLPLFLASILVKSGSLTARSSSEVMRLEVILTSPLNGVNLTALANKLSRICYSLGLSKPI